MCETTLPSESPCPPPPYLDRTTNVRNVLRILQSFDACFPRIVFAAAECVSGILKTFEIPDIPVKWYTFKRRLGVSTSDQPPNEERTDGDRGGPDGAEPEEAEEEREEEKEEILSPPPALEALYSQRGEGETFFLAMGGWARGAVFECSWKVRNTRLPRYTRTYPSPLLYFLTHTESTPTREIFVI